MKVQVYRNLHKKGHVYSVRNHQTKLVVDRTSKILLKDVLLKVSEAGRQRVLKEKRKNVHAFLQGERCELPEIESKCSVVVSYNPYLYSSFVDSDGRSIFSADYILVDGPSILGYGVKYE